MILTNENYFSLENQLHYMGTSQIKSFIKCESMALAEITGNYERVKGVALFVGSFVDAHFSKELDLFKAQNPQILTQQGELRAEYKQAEEIIARLERDEMFMEYMSGEKQTIMTGEIDGIPFKIKIDSYHPGKMIVDLKVMKDFENIWVEGQGKINFIEAWGYDLQGAIYQAIEGNNLPFYIAGATKEKTTDLAIFEIPQNYLDVAMVMVKKDLQRYQAIKQGWIDPVRCEKCDYCKSTKVLDSVISLDELNEI